MREQMKVVIRPADQGDVSLIFSSWLKSFRNGVFNVHVPNSIYFAEQHKLIETLIRRCEVLIACSPSDPAGIYGWICFERVQGIFTMHYAYTKHTFRGLGVARELLKHTNHDFKTAGCYTHETKIAERLSAKYLLVYHPYILVNYGEKTEEKPTLEHTYIENK